MAFKDVSGGATIDIKKEPNVPYEGIYQEAKIITTQIGKQFVYKFYDPKKKKKFGIFGFTMLNMAMENIVSGTMCRITYIGTEKMQTKFGMKDVHQCKVEVDEEYEPIEETETEPF